MLAAVVLVAVAGLVQTSDAEVAVARRSREFVVAMAALAGVLSSGLLRGVLIGAIISLVQLLRRASRPHVALLGRIPGTRRFSDRQRHPDNELIPGVLVFRPESGLLYFNINHVCDTIVTAFTRHRRRQGSWCSTCPPRRMLTCKALIRSPAWRTELTAAGIRVQAVEPRSSVRDRLRREGVDQISGRHQPVHLGG